MTTPAALRATPSRGQRWPTGKAGSAAFWVGVPLSLALI